MRKFVGKWCTKMDELGDHQYATATANSFDKALAAAIAGSKHCNVVEWVMVTEYLWVGGKRDGYWEKVGHWSGDYEHVEAA